MLRRETVNEKAFNAAPLLPFELRVKDFELAMQDFYDFFFDVNTFLLNKGLLRLDDMLRPAIMSGVLSDMMTASLAKHSRKNAPFWKKRCGLQIMLTGSRWTANAVRSMAWIRSR